MRVEEIGEVDGVAARPPFASRSSLPCDVVDRVAAAADRQRAVLAVERRRRRPGRRGSRLQLSPSQVIALRPSKS